MIMNLREPAFLKGISEKEFKIKGTASQSGVEKKEVKSAPKAKVEDSSKSEKESKAKLDAVDEKLKNLIDDPDISI